MTAQCLAIPEAVQRPVHQRRVLSVQLNAADGSASRIKQLIAWLITKASAGAVFVGFCELNGWELLQSDTDLMTNLPAMTARAASAGFAYSHLLTSTKHPYHLGLMSALPFDVLAEYGPPRFQRGVLHAYIPLLKLHVLVAHLHAHDSRDRTLEVTWLADNILRPLLERGERVVLQGDLNTLSPLDRAEHQASGLLQQLHRTDYAGFLRLNRKFLDAKNLSAIDYGPMGILLRTGMVDACAQGCRANNGTETEMIQWQSDGTDQYSKCMTTRCLKSVPTDFSTEWTTDVAKKHPPVRVDFALVSPAILRQGRGLVEAAVERTHLTGAISDHYPVELSFDIGEEYDLARRN